MVTARVPLLAFALALAALVGLLAAPEARGQGTASPVPARLRAFVSVESSGALVAFDVRSRRLLRRLTLTGKPHNLDTTADGRRVVVTSQQTGTLAIIDGRRLRVLRTVAGLRAPHDAKLTADGRYAFVTEESGGTLAVVDVERGRVVRRIGVGAEPHDLALGDIFWVTGAGSRLTVVECRHPGGGGCQSGPGRLSILARPSAGGPAHDIDRFPDRTEAWFTFWGSPRIGMLTGTMRSARRPEAVAGAMHLAVDFVSGQRIWVVGESGGGAILDRSGRVVHRVRIAGTLHHVALAPVSDLASVVRGSPGALVLLRRTSGELLGTLPLGGVGHDVGFALTG